MSVDANNLESEEILNGERYSPYCEICTGCGESGCCSPLACEQHPSGKYCETNLRNLKFGYAMYEALYDLIEESGDKPLQDKLSDLFDETWDSFFLTDN